MISFLNVGPPRSGSTSFYNMMSKHPQVNVGKIKEPLHYGYKLSNLSEYLSHWDYNSIDRSKNTILLDASPRMVYLDESLNLRKYLGRHIDEFYHICLIRDLKRYYRSRIFINYLIDYVMDLDFGDQKNNNDIDWNADYHKIDLNQMEELLDSNILKTRWWNIPNLSPLSHLMKVNNIFDINHVFILPIEFFEEYRERLLNFLKIEVIDLEYPLFNRSLGILDQIKLGDSSNRKIRIIELYSLIKRKVETSEILDKLIMDHLKKIDMLYNTKLYSHYYG